MSKNCSILSWGIQKDLFNTFYIYIQFYWATEWDLHKQILSFSVGFLVDAGKSYSAKNKLKSIYIWITTMSQWSEAS